MPQPTKTITVDDETRMVIGQMTFAHDFKTSKLVGTLPSGQLERSLYTKVNKALEALGGKWNRSAGGHIFDRDPREQLGLLGETGEMKVVKDGWFPTPPEVVEQMIREAGMDKTHRVLEPSAGEGAIADVVRPHVAAVDVCELDPVRREILRTKGYTLLAFDFLAMTGQDGAYKYPRILMNPPFENEQDVQHVIHAFEQWLAPKGILVAIMSEGVMFRTTKLSSFFRAYFLTPYGRTVALPAGTFKSSGTDVATRMVTLFKPKEG